MNLQPHIRWPCTRPFRITQHFGENPNHPDYGYGPLGHPGLDIVSEDLQVRAPVTGVARVRRGLPVYGNQIEILTGGHWTTRLSHLATTLVADNTPVTLGEPLGTMGNTGRAFGVHLDWEMRHRGIPVDPLRIMEEIGRMEVGYHGGNTFPLTDLDREILRRTPAGVFWFIPGEGITPADIQWLLGFAPRCQIGVRPYYTPGAPFEEYLEQCKRAMSEYHDVIPDDQKHLQIWNEQNMPRWAQWEGFGDQLDDMKRFDQWYCDLYTQLKAFDPSWPIGWPPLTPGNRDAWFKGDAIGHYYMHGPSGCAERLTETQRRTAIAEGPCRNSLGLADEYYSHIYIHQTDEQKKVGVSGRDNYKEPFLGLRFERYRLFFPKPMKIWICEAGFPNRANWPEWGDAALVDWLNTLAQHNVAGVAQWILGNKDQWGSMWYEGGQPRPAVDMIHAWLEDKPQSEAPMTQYELETARKHRDQLPATIKAANVRGYHLQKEWFQGQFVYGLCHDKITRKYYCLKLRVGTWEVVEEFEV